MSRSTNKQLLKLCGGIYLKSMHSDRLYQL